MHFFWNPAEPAPEGRAEELEALVVKELLELGLDDPNDLFFHSAFSGEAGESIFVVPIEDGYELSYVPARDWTAHHAAVAVVERHRG